MTTPTGSSPLPPTLTTYAETLLTGTTLTLAEAEAVATGNIDLSDDLTPVQDALRAGWRNAHIDPQTGGAS